MKSTKLEITKFKRNHLDWPKWRAYGRKPSDALLETIQNKDRLIVSITGNGIFFPKIISGTESETNERWSSIYIWKLQLNKEHSSRKIWKVKWSCQCTHQERHGSCNTKQHQSMQDPWFWQMFYINTLDTMRKLNKTNGYVGIILDKLCGIRAAWVRTDDSWQK